MEAGQDCVALGFRAAICCKKDSGLQGRGRGRLTSPADRQKALQILPEGIAAGARASELAKLMGVGLTTLQRWRREFKADGNGVDRCKGSTRKVAHRLSVEEGQRILLTCNEPKYADLPPGQILLDLADLADQGFYIGSERSFYRVLRAHGQLHRRADDPKQVWSWDISYLPTSVKGIWLYLYLVVDIWSRKVVT